MTHIVSIILALILLSIFPSPLKHINITLEPKPVSEQPQPTPEELLLEDMSIEEKVGQLFIFGFDGTTLSKENKDFFETYKPGGILLLKKNISSPSQLKKLIEDIQSTTEIPLFISIDQEGGEVARIRWNSDITKAQPHIDTSQQAYTDALNKGKYLKDLGINTNFAPVIEYITDQNSFIYNRAYRGSQKEVYLKSISAIKGYTDNKVISVPKHYPGHSNTSVDSHYDLPVVKIEDNQWDEYIKPFSDVLSNTTIDALMVGHVQFPNIDNQYPTTMSEEIIKNRLITNLEYKGVIISDDMEMGALEDIDTYPKTAKRALQAGIDMLIYSKYMNRHPNIQQDVYNYILDEAEKGNINIDDKVLKILKLKFKYNILHQ
jgi:beta-N-acetylhexosaminidase